TDTTSPPTQIPTTVVRPTSVPPLTTYVTARPGAGCDDTHDSRIQWTTVKSTIGCSAGSGTTVTKLGTFNGPGDVELGELRFGITNQSFPSRYSVAVTVADLLDPSSEGGVSCAGFAVHTNADGSTFEEVVVCGDGAFSIIRWLNNAE